MKKEYTFHGQRPGENVIEVINCHPYVMYHPGIKAMVILLAALSIFLFIPKFYLVALVLIAIFAFYLFRATYLYLVSVYVITNQRILSVDQKGFFSRQVAEIDLDKIIDMTSEMSGFAKSVLKYGNLVLHSASAKDSGAIVLKNVANPYELQQVIANLETFQINQKKNSRVQ